MNRPDIEYIKRKCETRDLGRGGAEELIDWIEWLEYLLEKNRIDF